MANNQTLHFAQSSVALRSVRGNRCVMFWKTSEVFACQRAAEAFFIEKSLSKRPTLRSHQWARPRNIYCFVASLPPAAVIDINILRSRCFAVKR